MLKCTSSWGFLLVIMWLLGACSAPSERVSTAEDRLERRVDSVLSLMTIEEKIGQLTMYNGTWDFTGPVPANDDAQARLENIRSGGVGAMLNVLSVPAICEAQREAVDESRLGIPMLFGYDVIHGYKSMMPIPLAQASSWDFDVAKMANRIAAREAAASGISLVFAPMVDVSRDARWGRIMEGAGEDPYLSAVMARAWVEGLQGEDLSDEDAVAACAKHFAGYAFAEAGKEYNSTEMSEQTLRNVVLPPFKAAVDAGVAAVMNGFNDLNGIPVTADGRLQREILKGEWGFDGFVVSDFNSVMELITHGYSPDDRSAAKDAFNAGSDMEMESRLYERHLKQLLEESQVSINDIDDAVRRVLRIKFRLGLFEDPYKYCDDDDSTLDALVERHKEEALDIARRSMVLLKNENGTLPLTADKKVAVIGSLGGSKDVPLGNWRAQAIDSSAISLLEGIQASSSKQVTYAEGYRLTQGRRSFVFDLEWAPSSKEGFSHAIAAAKSADIVVMALGEDCYQTGEGRSQTDIGLKGDQLELFHAVRAVNPNIVVVLMNGRPLAIPELASKASAILESWHGGSYAGQAIADILYGRFNPCGKLPVSFPYSSGQEPLYYNHKNTGRPVTNEFDKGLVFWAHYSDNPPEALFPFGYGLSYSDFELGKPKLDKEVFSRGDSIRLSVNIRNKSELEGTEVVQFYIHDLFGSATSPVKELIGFERVTLLGGEEKLVHFTVDETMLARYWPDGNYRAEAGEFEVMVGKSSAELHRLSFRLME